MGLQDVHQVMGYSVTLCRGRLGRADIQTTIHLQRVGIDQFAAALTGQAESQFALA
jgi:hypothetical protein